MCHICLAVISTCLEHLVGHYHVLFAMELCAFSTKHGGLLNLFIQVMLLNDYKIQDVLGTIESPKVTEIQGAFSVEELANFNLLTESLELSGICWICGYCWMCTQNCILVD